MVETGYRELIVLRHAKAEQVASSDRVRKLTARGRRDASAAGRWLSDNRLVPDVLLTSPAARARATAELVAQELTSPPALNVVEELYGASVDEALEVVATVAGDVRRVLIVGHNPTMEDLAFALQRAPTDLSEAHLPTAGLAVLRTTEGWGDFADGSADLTHWHAPRD